MIRRIPILLLLAAAACAHPAPPVPIAVPAPPQRAISSEPDSDEVAVYAALVDQLFSARRGAIVVADSVGRREWPEGIREARLDSAVAAEIEADFRERNRTTITFPAETGASHPVRVYASEEVLVLDGGGRLRGGYAVFVRRFPGVPGYHTVSRPGFDSARRYALVTRSYYCGPLCADGGYVLLERRPDGWHVLSGRVLWVS
ncbi:MAG TPA: hypothetical protein VF092_23610 [Longimicrobium sp.]